MNKTVITNVVIATWLVLLCSSLVFSNSANADYSKRSQKWESTFKLAYALDSSVDGQGGSTFDMKSDVGWGFSLGYNLNQHITLAYDFTSTTPSYQANVVTDDGATVPINHKMDIFDNQFSVTYNLFASSFTPYVQGGVGWSFVDTNIASGPPNTVCWWDPWWGYICDGYQNTFNDTRFSYNAAVGLRYELPNRLLLKASYKQGWIDFNNSDDASIGSFQLEIGSVF